MDLGDILGNVRNAVDTYRYVQETIDPPSIRDRVAAVVDSNPATTFVAPTPAVRAAASKKGCRRRRRRLLTKSDLGDIAALKGIVGTGKHFETILAAAMYRSR